MWRACACARAGVGDRRPRRRSALRLAPVGVPALARYRSFDVVSLRNELTFGLSLISLLRVCDVYVTLVITSSTNTRRALSLSADIREFASPATLVPEDKELSEIVRIVRCCVRCCDCLWRPFTNNTQTTTTTTNRNNNQPFSIFCFLLCFCGLRWESTAQLQTRDRYGNATRADVALESIGTALATRTLLRRVDCLF